MVNRVGVRKGTLVAAIALTSAAPLAFVRFNEPTASLQIYKALAKGGSLCGTVLLAWQFLLGFRQAVGNVARDLLWVLSLHKSVGRYALFLIVLHPLFIALYYLEKKGTNPLKLEGGWPFPAYTLLGFVAFFLFLVIVVTSVFLRRRLSLRTWYMLHLSSYLALPLVFVHSLAIGMTVRETALGSLWRLLAAFLAAFYVFRTSCWLGLLAKKHVVREVEQVGPNVVKITAEPIGSKLDPQLGQFIYFRRGFWGPTRPFTVSHYDRDSGNISVTVKALGRGTARLQSIQPGETVYIDGPYGVFARAALETDRPLVMIAGGIGITPFRRLFEELAYEPGRELHLFYGNRRRNEIVYEEELNNVETVTVTHVISDDPDHPGERGYITLDLMGKYLQQEFAAYDFLICGPPAMTVKLEAELAQAGVPPRQIHHELFSY
jgi:predicted ferric reductase